MYTYVATVVVSPCGKSNVSVVGHQPRHVCKMLRHGPSCSRRGRPLCAAAPGAAPGYFSGTAPCAAPAVSSLADTARPLAVRRAESDKLDSAGAARGAAPCSAYSAKPGTTAPQQRLLLLTNWLFGGIFDQMYFRQMSIFGTNKWKLV